MSSKLVSPKNETLDCVFLASFRLVYAPRQTSISCMFLHRMWSVFPPGVCFQTQHAAAVPLCLLSLVRGIRLEECVLADCVFSGIWEDERDGQRVHRMCTAAYGRMIHRKLGQTWQFYCGPLVPQRSHAGGGRTVMLHGMIHTTASIFTLQIPLIALLKGKSRRKGHY